MVNVGAKVLFLHILQRDAVVIEPSLIHRQYGSIGTRHLNEGGDGVYREAQIMLALLKSFFIRRSLNSNAGNVSNLTDEFLMKLSWTCGRTGRRPQSERTRMPVDQINPALTVSCRCFNELA